MDRHFKAAEMMGRFFNKHKNKFKGVHIVPLGWADDVHGILGQAEIEIKHH